MMKLEYFYYLLVLILGLFFPVSAFSYYLFQRVKPLTALTKDFTLSGIGESNIVIQISRRNISVPVLHGKFWHTIYYLNDKNNSNNKQSSAGNSTSINMDA